MLELHIEHAKGVYIQACVAIKMVVEAHSMHCDIFEVMTISDIELAHIPI